MKPGSNRLKKAYALIAASCLCTGSLLILKSFWELYTGTLTAGAADAPAARLEVAGTVPLEAHAELLLGVAARVALGQRQVGHVDEDGAVCFYCLIWADYLFSCGGVILQGNPLPTAQSLLLIRPPHGNCICFL